MSSREWDVSRSRYSQTESYSQTEKLRTKRSPSLTWGYEQVTRLTGIGSMQGTHMALLSFHTASYSVQRYATLAALFMLQ